ncbi:MAG TPA: hypothetical protein VFA07_04590 [Chthonomonadaceae bacterium]|nr:hypothetical protein [Chthonomonadaceae bacterium]
MTDMTVGTAQTLRLARQWRARTRRTALTFGVAWRALAVLLAAGTLDLLWPWPAVLRALVFLGVLFLAAAGWWRDWQAERRRPPRPEQVAREIEARRPEVDNALIHALQFREALTRDPAQPGAPLIRQEIARAEQAAARLPLRDVVERELLRREGLPLAIVAGCLLVTLLLFPRAYRFEVPRFALFWTDAPPFTLTDFDVSPPSARVREGESLAVTVHVGGLLPHRLELVAGMAGVPQQSVPLTETDLNTYTASLDGLQRDTWYYVAADTGRSARCWVHVDTAPHLRKLTATFHPPAYTRRPDTTADIPLGGPIQGLSTTRGDLHVDADHPLAGGEIAIRRNGMPDLRVRLVPERDTPNRADGAFAIERDGEYRISLKGTAAEGGMATPDAGRGKIVLLHDETPVVTVTAPGRNLLARANMTVPLQVDAEDDIALQRLEIHQVVNRGKDTAQTINLPDRPRATAYTSRLDLKAMHAKPGDVIEYYATAYDNDPQGVHNADSQRYWVWVVSDADYRRVLARQRGPSQMSAQYRALVDALRQLVGDQAALARDMGYRLATPNTLRKRQRALQARAGALAQQMRALASQPPQFDIEKGLQQRLRQTAQQIGQAQSSMQAAQRAAQPDAMAAAGQTAARQLKRALQGPGQQIDLSLDAILKLLPLYRDVARLQKLTAEQTLLAQQAQQAADTIQQTGSDSATQSRLRSLADRQAAVRNSLSDLVQNLQDHAAEAREIAPEATALADRLAQAIVYQNIPQTMQRAQSAFEQQDAPAGARPAESACRALAGLLPTEQASQNAAQKTANSLSQAQLGMDAGQSLAQMTNQMGVGLAQETGEPPSGEESVPKPGSRPGNTGGQEASGDEGQQAIALSLMVQPSGGGTRKENNGGVRGERIGELSSDSVEKVGSEPPQPPPKASDREASRYPVEYRRLVRDYFKAVAGGK